MPIERRRTPNYAVQPQKFSYQAFGAANAPIPPAYARPRSQVNTREASPLERVDFEFSKYAPGILTAPARIAERPVAYLDSFFKSNDSQGPGPIASALKWVGDVTPLGAVVRGATDFINTTDLAARAVANANWAHNLGKYGNMSSTTPTDLWGGGGLFGIGDRRLTVGELREELTKRGWDIDPKTGQRLPWEKLVMQASQDPFAFGDRAMSSSVALDTLASMVISPTNMLFMVPGAGWAAAGNKIRAGIDAAGMWVGASRWARPIITAATPLTRVRYGFGYFQDRAIAALRSPVAVSAADSARTLLAGSTQNASVRGLLTAADTVLRNGRIFGSGVADATRAFTGFKGVANPTAWGYAKAYGGAYYRGAFRLQVGSVAAEYGAGLAAQAAQGTILEGGTNLIYSALQNVNNATPLSENESFMLFALTTMPAVPLLKEHAGIPGRAIRQAIGDNDVVLLAQQMYPDLKGQAAIDKVYEGFGRGNVEKGREVAQWALHQAERGVAFKELGLATRMLGSFDALVTHNTYLNSILGERIGRMRDAGQISSQRRVQTLLDVVRKGEVIKENVRAFEWNASNEAILGFWGRFHDAWASLAPQAQKLGITALTTSKIVTKEMLTDALHMLMAHAPETGIVPGWIRDEMLLAMPGLLDDPKAYGDFWERLAVHSEQQSISGRGKGTDTRVTMEELRAEVEKLRDAAPGAEELFHEASALERNGPDGVKVDALKGSPLRKIYSKAQVDQIRDEAAGIAKAVRQEEKTLVHVRNTEFDRNGNPKKDVVDITVGYRGTVYKKADNPTTWNGKQIIDYFEPTEGDGPGFWFDPDDPTHFSVGAIEEHPGTSEAILKAVELGGRTIESFIDEDGMQGFVLARHGFVEVARYAADKNMADKEARLSAATAAREAAENRVNDYIIDKMRAAKPGESTRTITDALFNDPKYLELKGEVAKLADEVQRIYREWPGEVGFYAYVGGDVTKLREKLSTFDGATKPVAIVEYETGATIGHTKVPQNPEMIPIDLLVPFRVFDREVTPISADVDAATRGAGFASYLDELDAEIMASGRMDPVTLEFDFAMQRAELTDGNHRLAIALRHPDIFPELPVIVEVRANSLGKKYSHPVVGMTHSELITAADIVGYVRSPFKDYKASRRFVSSKETGRRMADNRAAKASMLVPSMEAIGPSPTNAEGIFHGSGNLFDEFDDNFLRSSSLVGRGVYSTDALDVAVGYAGGGHNKSGHIYYVEPKAGLKTYDLNKPWDESTIDLASEIQMAVEDVVKKTNHDPNSLAAETVREVFETSGSAFEMFRVFFDTFFDGGDGGFLGKVNDAIVDVFKKNGYEGFTHEGGNIVGWKSHNVTVVFDAANMKIKDRVPLSELRPALPARHKLIQQRLLGIRNQLKDHMKRMEELNQRAIELKTITIPENLQSVHQALPKEEKQALATLVETVRREYPSYELSLDRGAAFWDPADGLVPALQLERSVAKSVLYDYGPLSKVTAFYNALFGPVSSKRLSAMSRTAVYNLALREGASSKQVARILNELNVRVREQTVGPLSVPYFRDIGSLPANQVNMIAKSALPEKVWANIEARYGNNGFHHLLDQAANEFVRRVDKTVARGNKPGALNRALREGYRLWEYAPVLGSGTRFISKQFYHLFRFMLDVRWHLLNLIEADVLTTVREGFDTNRFGRTVDDTGKMALQQHSKMAGIPQELFTKNADQAGPAVSQDLFDAGLYLHNRNILPIVTKNFDKARARSVESVLDALPRESSLYRMLEERFGTDTKSWSKQLDDMMYNFDKQGVRNTVIDAAKKDGWTDKDFATYGGMLDRITELNQRAYDDIVAVYTGNLNRTRIERVLNSYWLYWPISYQIKATKWMMNALMNRWGGMQTNMTGLYLFNRVQERYQDLLANNPAFAKEMDENEDLWFAVNMLFPATPMSQGVSLNRGVRYVASLLAPEVIPPYLGVDGPEDIPTRVLEMGPIYSARFYQSILNNLKQDAPAEERRWVAVNDSPPIINRP